MLIQVDVYDLLCRAQPRTHANQYEWVTRSSRPDEPEMSKGCWSMEADKIGPETFVRN
jgi:hypothetical protein